MLSYFPDGLHFIEFQAQMREANKKEGIGAKIQMLQNENKLSTAKKYMAEEIIIKLSFISTIQSDKTYYH